MTREQLLEKAKTIVCKDRTDSYGEPENNFENIANLWSTYLNMGLTAHDVAMMMILLKIARTKTGVNVDNYVDIAGYAACAAEIICSKGETKWTTCM